MNNSTLNHNITETFTNSTTPLIVLVNSLYACFSSINVLVGLPTHICVIWLIITRSESGTTLEFFTLNFSVCEIIICLSCFLDILTVWFSSLEEIVYFLLGLLITGRPLFQCLICVERYLAVVHPVTFLKYKPLRYKVICCTAVWIISLGSCLACMFLVVVLNDMVVYTWLLSIQFLLFLSIQLFCCVAVLRALKQSGPGERGREKEEENHTKRRAFYIILITTVSMFITYTPLSLAGFYSIMTDQYVEHSRQTVHSQNEVSMQLENNILMHCKQRSQHISKAPHFLTTPGWIT
nr:chemokine XC receptor 1-like [Misgurnus anguillicaudatus]